MAHHVQIHTSHNLEGIDIRNSELKHVFCDYIEY